MNYVLLAFALATTLYPSTAGIIRANGEPIAAETQEIRPIAVGQPKLTEVKPTTLLPTTTKVISLPPPTPDFFPQRKLVWITAYSSTPEETDDTPFTTASGSTVRDGVVAANFLPFGTRVQIPALFGAKVFVVEDRMHERNANKLDIWMETKTEALRFGANYAEIVVLN